MGYKKFTNLPPGGMNSPVLGTKQSVQNIDHKHYEYPGLFHVCVLVPCLNETQQAIHQVADLVRSSTREEDFRLERARETFGEVRIHIENEFWNT